MQGPSHPQAKKFVKNSLFENINTFEDLESRISNLPTNKEIGDAFEVFAEGYLATQKAVQAKSLWPFETVPSSILKKLSLDTGKDMGVDGVIEARSGELQAYQVKFRSGRPSLTWDELSTFMGLSDQVDQRILFTNCNDLPKLMNDRSGFFCIRGNDLDRLEKRDFDAIQHWLRGDYKPVSKKTPLPHQEEALEAITEALNDNDRTTALMACGTGKTLVALWTAERMGHQNILVLVPSLALLRQTLHEWLKETRWEELAFLCVCSDPTVTKNVDEVIVRQSDVDFPVSTDSDVVRRFLSKDGVGVKVIFSTYQSAQVISKGMDGSDPFDLAIFDEAHKTAGREGAKFGFALTDENIPIKKRFFMTATPRHYDIRKRDKEGDAKLVFSMDVPEVYGPIAFKLPFAEAAERDIICNYKVLISVVTTEMVNKELLKKGEVLVEGDAVHAQHVASQIALQQAVEKYGVNKIITFHRTVRGAKVFSGDGVEGIENHLPQYLAYHVSGSQRTSERERIMKEFKREPHSIISNARCLTEGVDVPAVDMVAFLAPKRSKIDIVQATGRAMRKSDSTEKTTGYVLVPLFLEIASDESIEEAVSKGQFDEIWNVLQAMKEQDNLLAEVIQQMRVDIGKRGKYDGREFADKVEFLGLQITLNQIRESITAICIQKLSDTWDEWYGELLKFKNSKGHINVPHNDPQYTLLFHWASRQRYARKKGRMSPERIDRLNSIGFEWSLWIENWDKMFQQLIEYQNKHGDTDVPQRWKNNLKLANWVGVQRTNKNKGILDSERIKKLEKFGFSWEPKKTQWYLMIEELKDYKKKHGNCDVPSESKEYLQLGRWVSSIRHQNKQGKLSLNKVELFEEMGFIWTPKEDDWNDSFIALKEFKRKYGHLRVPARWKADMQLSKWVGHQRTFKDRGLLDADREAKLNGIGFLWDVFLEQWEKMYMELCSYERKYGHCNVSSKDNKALASWVTNSRTLKKQGRLTKEKVKKLESIGLIWNLKAYNWDKLFQQLIEYKDKHGDTDVPRKWKNNLMLANWVSLQRTNKNKGILDSERIKKLEKIGFSWEPVDNRWESMYLELKNFKKKFGHTDLSLVEKHNKRLSKWVGHQRSFKKGGKLQSDREKKLDEIGLVWNKYDANWNKMFAELLEYKTEYKDCNVPWKWSDNQKLAQWVGTQREAKKKGKLSPERSKRLENIGFEWKVR